MHRVFINNSTIRHTFFLFGHVPVSNKTFLSTVNITREVVHNDLNVSVLFTEKHYGQTPYGYLHVERKRYESPLAKYFMDAVHELGYKEVDTNGGQQVGKTAQ